MRHIYRRAERVLSWLSEADEDTHLAFSLIERWADAVLATSPKLESWPNGEAMRMAVTTIERPFDEEGWAALGSLTRKNILGEALDSLRSHTGSAVSLDLW
jgi:hypothetical protein